MWVSCVFISDNYNRQLTPSFSVTFSLIRLFFCMSIHEYKRLVLVLFSQLERTIAGIEPNSSAIFDKKSLCGYLKFCNNFKSNWDAFPLKCEVICLFISDNYCEHQIVQSFSLIRPFSFVHCSVHVYLLKVTVVFNWSFNYIILHLWGFSHVCSLNAYGRQK